MITVNNLTLFKVLMLTALRLLCLSLWPNIWPDIITYLSKHVFKAFVRVTLWLNPSTPPKSISWAILDSLGTCPMLFRNPSYAINELIHIGESHCKSRNKKSNFGKQSLLLLQNDHGNVYVHCDMPCS